MTGALELSDAPVTNGSEATVSTTLTLGRCLAEARKVRGLTVADVAQVIKYSPRQIEALENDQFAKLPDAAIVRGFIRNYARLLQLDSIGLLAMFDKHAPVSASAVDLLVDSGAGAALPQPGMRSDQLVRKLMLGAAVLALSGAMALYHLWPVPQNQGEVSPIVAPPPPVSSVTSSVVPAQAIPAEQQVAGNMSDSSVLTTTVDDVPGQIAGFSALPSGGGVPSLATELQASVQDAESRQLIFSFEDKSWVEVKDATRRTIFAQNNLPGTHQVVTGKPPFTLVVGNAPRVHLQYEERSIDMQPYTRVDVARFSLE